MIRQTFMHGSDWTIVTTTSGRIEEGDVARLKSLGVRRIINLALEASPGALADEAAIIARHGLSYTHIPVPFDAPDQNQFEAFRAALAQADGMPVHVHCIMNFRVSAFFYLLNRDHRGMPEAEARALMEQQWAPDKMDDPKALAWAAFIK